MTSPILKNTLQNKITFSMLFVGLVSTVLALVLVYYFGKSTFKTTIGRGFAELAEVTSQKLETLINHHVEEAHFLSSSADVINLIEKSNRLNLKADKQLLARWEKLNEKDPEVRSILENEASQYIRNYESFEDKRGSSLGMHYYIFATDLNGTVIAANKKTPFLDYHEEKWWQTVFAKGKGTTLISDILFDTSVNSYIFNISTPIYKNGAVIGVLNMVHNADAFFKWVTSIKTGKRDHTMLVSSDGIILYCPIFPVKTHKLAPELQQKIFKPEPGWDVSTVDVHYPGRESLNGFAPLDITFRSGPANFGGKNWYVFTSQDPLETFSPIYILLQWILLAGFMGVGALTFMGWLASKRLVKPIRDLQEGIRHIGFGQLDYRINVKTGDEIEAVADEFNEMAKKMKALYHGLEQKVSERTRELETRTKELEIRNNEMYTLFAMGATLNECVSREEILTIAPSKILGMMKADGVVLILTHGPSAPVFKSLPTLIVKHEETQNFYRVIMKNILRTGELFMIENTADEIEKKEIAVPSHFEYVSVVTVPLFAKKEIVGGLSLLFKRYHPITAQEEEILSAIGHQVGNAIDHVQPSPHLKKPRD